MVIFGAGVITGGLVVHRSMQTQQRPFPRVQNLPRPVAPAVSAGVMRSEFLRRIQREIDLTSEQGDRIDRILKDSQERSRKLMEPIAPQLREELERTRDEFRSVLNPVQQQRFDQLLKQQQRARDPRPLRDRLPDGAPRPGAGERRPPAE